MNIPAQHKENIMEHVLPQAAQPPRYKYFDPQQPEAPDEIFGLPTGRVQQLAPTIGSLLIDLPYEVRGSAGREAGLALRYETEHLIAVAPLVERALAGEELAPEDVRPFRKPLKRLMPSVNAVDKLLAGSVIGLPLRATLNRKLEERVAAELPGRVQAAAEQAGQKLAEADAQITPYIDLLGMFESPKAQVQYELASIAATVRDHAYKHAKGRQPSAHNAANGIDRTIDLVLVDRRRPEPQLRIMSTLLNMHPVERSSLPSLDPDSAAVKWFGTTELDALAIAAPDIIEGLDNALPERMRDGGFLNGVQSQPHHSRWLASGFVKSTLRKLRVTPQRIVSLLPERGEDVRALYDHVKHILNVTNGDVERDDGSAV